MFDNLSYSVIHKYVSEYADAYLGGWVSDDKMTTALVGLAAILGVWFAKKTYKGVLSPVLGPVGEWVGGKYASWRRGDGLYHDLCSVIDHVEPNDIDAEHYTIVGENGICIEVNHEWYGKRLNRNALTIFKIFQNDKNIMYLLTDKEYDRLQKKVLAKFLPLWETYKAQERKNTVQAMRTEAYKSDTKKEKAKVKTA